MKNRFRNGLNGLFFFLHILFGHIDMGLCCDGYQPNKVGGSNRVRQQGYKDQKK